jgi:hypothetical protein
VMLLTLGLRKLKLPRLIWGGTPYSVCGSDHN